MFRKIAGFLMIGITIFTLSLPVHAASESVLFNRNLSNTGEFLVNITRPEGDESTFKKSYVICGNTGLSGMRVEIFIEKSGGWERFKTTDGETGWNVGESVFMKEVVLPDTGANRIRIAAFKNSDARNNNLELGQNLQSNDYNITVLDSKARNRINSGTINVAQTLQDFLLNFK